MIAPPVVRLSSNRENVLGFLDHIADWTIPRCRETETFNPILCSVDREGNNCGGYLCGGQRDVILNRYHFDIELIVVHSIIPGLTLNYCVWSDQQEILSHCADKKWSTPYVTERINRNSSGEVPRRRISVFKRRSESQPLPPGLPPPSLPPPSLPPEPPPCRHQSWNFPGTVLRAGESWLIARCGHSSDGGRGFPGRRDVPGGLFTGEQCSGAWVEDATL